jgi:hypothetical protein
MIKGGGAVLELSREVKRIWTLFQQLCIIPSFKWLSRNAIEMQLVDSLSKSTSFSVHASALHSLQGLFSREIKFVHYGQISNTIQIIVGRSIRCALITPVWEGKSWWPVLVARASSIVPISIRDIIFNSRPGTPIPTWSFVLALFD